MRRCAVWRESDSVGTFDGVKRTTASATRALWPHTTNVAYLKQQV